MPITQLPAGTNLSSISSGDFDLQRGGTYIGVIHPSSGMTLGTYGNPAMPKPVVKGRVEAANKVSDVSISGIRFDGTGIKSTGLRFINPTRLKIADCDVYNFSGNGLTIEGYNGGIPLDCIVEGNTFHKNHPASGAAHCQGFFLSYSKGTIHRFNVYDTNGWDGAGGATKFNHNCYLHGSNDGVVNEWNVFANASSYGCQQRPGGDSRHNVFYNNEYDHSYGYVNGEAVRSGGVRGEITDNWYVPGPRNGAWAMDLSNLADVKMHDCYFGRGRVVNVLECHAIANPAAYLRPAAWKAALQDLFGCAIKKTAGGSGVTTLRANILPPNANYDMAKALGPNFLANARADARKAAAKAIAALRAELGVGDPAPNPTPTPDPQPTPGLTLESAGRTNPTDLHFILENGALVIKYIQPGVDPRWSVTGDTVTRKQ